MPFEPPERRLCDRASQMQATLDAVFAFIATHIEENGYAPSQREIAKQCYIAPSSVPRYLDRLEMQGRIIREEGRARSIRLSKPTET
jgi:SOS-response transcriptional repressor LexA